MAIVAFEVSEDKAAKFIVAVQRAYGDAGTSDHKRSEVLRRLVDGYIEDAEKELGHPIRVDVSQMFHPTLIGDARGYLVLRRLPDLDKLGDLVSGMAAEISAVRGSIGAMAPPGDDGSKQTQALEHVDALERKVGEAGRLLGRSAAV